MGSESPTPLLFLDIDGVLNDHRVNDLAKSGTVLSDRAERLNRILLETGARIVVSSAWRYLILRGEMNLEGFRWLLRTHGVLGDRMVGHTAADTMHDGVWSGVAGSWPIHNERGRQIAEWLGDRWEYKGCRYVVLDDLDLGISEAGHPFVQCDGTVGLTDADADRAIAIIQGATS